VAVVEEEAAKVLRLPIAQVGLQKFPRFGSRLERRPASQLLAEETPAELQRRLQLDVLGLTQSWRRAYVGAFRRQQTAQTAEAHQHLARHIDRGLALHAGAYKEGEQLGIRQGLWPRASNFSRGRSVSGQSVIAMNTSLSVGWSVRMIGGQVNCNTWPPSPIKGCCSV